MSIKLAGFELPEGQHRVTVYFPWSAQTVVSEVHLSDGASIIPVKKKCKLLCFGDSITQGYTSRYTSLSYVNQTARALDAEVVNQGIGGYYFNEATIESSIVSYQPDVITVAYGTNDWRKHPRDVFFSDVKAFFENLEKTYPNIPKIVVTPIWRKNHDAQTDFSSMDEVREGIRLAAQVCTGVTVVDGLGLVPQDVEYFGDYGCHPNGRGFACFFQNLWAQIKKD